MGGKTSFGELAVQKADTGAGGLVAKLCSTLATTWTVACQAPLSLGCPQARILERVTLPSPMAIIGHTNGFLKGGMGLTRKMNSLLRECSER